MKAARWHLQEKHTTGEIGAQRATVAAAEGEKEGSQAYHCELTPSTVPLGCIDRHTAAQMTDLRPTRLPASSHKAVPLSKVLAARDATGAAHHHHHHHPDAAARHLRSIHSKFDAADAALNAQMQLATAANHTPRVPFARPNSPGLSPIHMREQQAAHTPPFATKVRVVADSASSTAGTPPGYDQHHHHECDHSIHSIRPNELQQLGHACCGGGGAKSHVADISRSGVDTTASSIHSSSSSGTSVLSSRSSDSHLSNNSSHNHNSSSHDAGVAAARLTRPSDLYGAEAEREVFFEVMQRMWNEQVALINERKQQQQQQQHSSATLSSDRLSQMQATVATAAAAAPARARSVSRSTSTTIISTPSSVGQDSDLSSATTASKHSKANRSSRSSSSSASGAGADTPFSLWERQILSWESRLCAWKNAQESVLRARVQELEEARRDMEAQMCAQEALYARRQASLRKAIQNLQDDRASFASEQAANTQREEQVRHLLATRQQELEKREAKFAKMRREASTTAASEAEPAASSAASASVTALQEELHALRSQLRSAQDQVAASEVALEQSEASWVSRAEAWGEHRARMQAEVSTLQEALRSREHEAAQDLHHQARSQAQQAHQQVQELQQQALATAAVSAASAAIASANSLLPSQSQSSSAAEVRARFTEQFDAELGSLRMQHRAELSEVAEAHRDALAEASETLQAAKRAEDLALAQVQKMRDELRTTNAKLLAAETELNTTRARLAAAVAVAATADRNDATVPTDSLQGELQAARSLLAQKQAVVVALQDEIASLQRVHADELQRAEAAHERSESQALALAAQKHQEELQGLREQSAAQLQQAQSQLESQLAAQQKLSEALAQQESSAVAAKEKEREEEEEAKATAAAAQAALAARTAEVAQRELVLQAGQQALEADRVRLQAQTAQLQSAHEQHASRARATEEEQSEARRLLADSQDQLERRSEALRVAEDSVRAEAAQSNHDRQQAQQEQQRLLAFSRELTDSKLELEQWKSHVQKRDQELTEAIAKVCTYTPPTRAHAHTATHQRNATRACTSFSVNHRTHILLRAFVVCRCVCVRACVCAL